MSCERETDRLEIIEMTRELTQERKKREMDRRLMDDLKQQVVHFYYTKINICLFEWKPVI